MIVNAAKNLTLAGNYLTPSLPQSNNVIFTLIDNCLFQTFSEPFVIQRPLIHIPTSIKERQLSE